MDILGRELSAASTKYSVFLNLHFSLMKYILYIVYLATHFHMKSYYVSAPQLG